MSDAGIIEAAIESVAERLIDEIHTSMPATVIKYNRDGSIDAQPDILTTDDNGDPLEMPIIYTVPVLMPGAGTLEIETPIEQGDKVLLIFAERSIDAWITRHEKTAETDQRRHSLTDAVAIPGFTLKRAKKTVIRDKRTGAQIEFLKNGTISINNGALEVTL